jgi:hypothetical protein
MNLKRSSPPGSKENNQEGVNFREVAGMSIDFLKGESSMYLVATDDGKKKIKNLLKKEKINFILIFNFKNFNF